MTRYIGKAISGTWSTYLDVSGWNQNDYTYNVRFDYGVYYNKKHEHTLKYDATSLTVTDWGTYECDKGYWSGNKTKGAGETLWLEGDTFYYPRKTYGYYINFWFSHSHTGSGASWKGTSSVSGSVYIPPLDSWTVSYNGNKPSGAMGTVADVPASQTKYRDNNIYISTQKPSLTDYTFLRWSTTADGSGTTYTAGSTYWQNSGATLYAQWSNNHPPSIEEFGEVAYTQRRATSGNGLKGFSGIELSFSGATRYANRTLSVVLNFYDSSNNVVMTDSLSHSDLTPTGDTFSGTFFIDPADVTASGTFSGEVTITDSAGYSKSYVVGSAVIEDRTWTIDIVFGDANNPVLTPSTTRLGTPLLVSLEVWNYSLPTPDYETVTISAPLELTDYGWSIPFTFGEQYVSDVGSTTPDVKVRAAYVHYDVVQKEHRTAFFTTSRNQNYSNGIYNNVFISGVDPKTAPHFTSRVWWCEINNPLYFPDTNYVEVGSNDTSVQGLTKVGDYLAAVKQSKTTDTAIYLLYPTSFEEETTYAVKQGVQGIGALARYSFNILGDETLFLSPNGVMAIVPTQDEEHKVQNRSYFVDGKLLKEDELSDAYSFVFDGKYWLAVSGHCYVLDGNQRNSWGNDKTNLVYECYYLENVPANCFVKYNDTLVFSSDDEVCAFKTERSVDKYIDAYDIDDKGVTNVPVKAEWATIFDDDSALHYYKTMQKKGNLVSILPTDYKFVAMEVDEETFNANKESYYTFDGLNYIQCTEESAYNATTVYYARTRSATKILVKKDEKGPVEIQRSFSLSSDIPSEMFLNKKFKKYKRLQFIIRNEEAEPFGVDSIVKNYTVGNYAKR